MPSRPQTGFTLVEIAIVLVIIGLLLGGVLKGQALIDSAKVKNLAQDFRNAQIMIHGYQDKYRRLPGDDNAAAARWNLASGHSGNGNGTLQGPWDASIPSSANESVLLWEHLRHANLAAGASDFSDAAAALGNLPRNAEGGRFGISGQKPLSTLSGSSFYACSDSIDGRHAEPLDLALDDGVAHTGALQALEQADGLSQADGARGARNAPYQEGRRYTLCMSY